MNEEQVLKERQMLKQQIGKRITRYVKVFSFRSQLSQNTSDHVVSHALKTLRNPQHLHNFASELQHRQEVELVIQVPKIIVNCCICINTDIFPLSKVADRCHDRIKQIDEQREVRAPIQVTIRSQIFSKKSRAYMLTFLLTHRNKLMRWNKRKSNWSCRRSNFHRNNKSNSTTWRRN